MKPALTALALLFSLPLQACPDWNGSLRQGALLWTAVAPGSEVTLDGERLMVSADGIVVMGFDRDAAPQATLQVTGPAPCEQTLAVAPRDYRIQRVDGVPQRTVEPDPADLERIRREAVLVRSARASSTKDTDFANGFQWPLLGPISGVYGSQRVYNGNPGRPHYGVDVAAPTGTPIAAPAPGVVVLAEPDLFYSGGTVIIDHGSQVSSTFLHLSRVSARVGQRVVAGDLLGEVGATGRATGPHLDWRMNWRNRRVDPQLLVPPMPAEAVPGAP